MAQYSVYVFCDECSQVHPMGIGISLNDGPADKASVGDTYAGKPLPPAVAMLTSNSTRCPNTGKEFVQRDNNQVFLVAKGE